MLASIFGYLTGRTLRQARQAAERSTRQWSDELVQHQATRQALGEEKRQHYIAKTDMVRLREDVDRAEAWGKTQEARVEWWRTEYDTLVQDYNRLAAQHDRLSRQTQKKKTTTTKTTKTTRRTR